MGSREDDDYWLVKYDLAPDCEVHDWPMQYDHDIDDWRCSECEEIERIYRFG